MITTDRLVLRPWVPADVAPFAAMGRDPEVRRYLGALQSRAEAEAAIAGYVHHQATRGHCFWALERRDDGAFLGFCGLKLGADGTPIAGEVEIGWRLARAHWGQGYAREAAQASLAWGWANLDTPWIGAITVPANVASWGLMERLGMTRVIGGEFDHPRVAVEHPLSRHFLYRIARPA